MLGYHGSIENSSFVSKHSCQELLKSFAGNHDDAYRHVGSGKINNENKENYKKLTETHQMIPSVVKIVLLMQVMCSWR